MIEANAVDTTPRAFSQRLAERETERETDPRSVLIELFQEELLQYPDLVADLVIARLGVKGFEIRPIDYKRGGA